MSISMKTFLLRILVPILLFASAFALPLYRFEADVSNFLTTVSVLFAILLGFFIATATTNYLSFQASLAAEGSALIMLFNLGALVRPSTKEQLADVIDRYVIATLDFRLSDYVEKTVSEYDALISFIDSLEPEDGMRRRQSALDSLGQAKTDMLRARTAISFAARRVTRATHWAIIILLGIILVALIYGLRDGQLFASIIAGTLFATLYLILLLLYEVDGNVFLEEQLAFEDVQGIFAAIGRPVYYPAFAIDLGLATPTATEYRVGVYVDRAISNEKEITLVTREARD